MEGLIYIGIHKEGWYGAEEEDVPPEIGKTLQISDGTEVMSYVTHWPQPLAGFGPLESGVQGGWRSVGDKRSVRLGTIRSGR